MLETAVKMVVFEEMVTNRFGTDLTNELNGQVKQYRRGFITMYEAFTNFCKILNGCSIGCDFFHRGEVQNVIHKLEMDGDLALFRYEEAIEKIAFDLVVERCAKKEE